MNTNIRLNASNGSIIRMIKHLETKQEADAAIDDSHNKLERNLFHKDIIKSLKDVAKKKESELGYIFKKILSFIQKQLGKETIEEKRDNRRTKTVENFMNNLAKAITTHDWSSNIKKVTFVEHDHITFRAEKENDKLIIKAYINSENFQFASKLLKEPKSAQNWHLTLHECKFKTIHKNAMEYQGL